MEQDGEEGRFGWNGGLFGAGRRDHNQQQQRGDEQANVDLLRETNLPPAAVGQN